MHLPQIGTCVHCSQNAPDAQTPAGYPAGVEEFGIRLFRVVDSLGLAQEIDLDLTGVGQLVLDLLGDVAREQHHLILRDLLGLDHDADLAAGLNGKAVGDAGEALGDFLELFETLDIVLDVLAPGAGRAAEMASAA